MCATCDATRSNSLSSHPAKALLETRLNMARILLSHRASIVVERANDKNFVDNQKRSDSLAMGHNWVAITLL